jgi:hypothetical protein
MTSPLIIFKGFVTVKCNVTTTDFIKCTATGVTNLYIETNGVLKTNGVLQAGITQSNLIP